MHAPHPNFAGVNKVVKHRSKCSGHSALIPAEKSQLALHGDTWVFLRELRIEIIQRRRGFGIIVRQSKQAPSLRRCSPNSALARHGAFDASYVVHTPDFMNGRDNKLVKSGARSHHASKELTVFPVKSLPGAMTS